MFVCKKCGRRYARKSGLKNHQKSGACEPKGSRQFPFTCAICGVGYDKANGLAIHIRTSHPEHYVQPVSRGSSGELTCALCGFKTNNLYTHVSKSHDGGWAKYKKAFPDSIKAVFSQRHRKKLSENKKAFYNSEAGTRLKIRQSKKMTGDGNPSKRPEVRLKISTSACKRIERNAFPLQGHSYGIRVSFTDSGETVSLRSFEEFKVYWALREAGIAFKYEKARIKYELNGSMHTYMPDFEVGDTIIEVKSYLSANTKARFLSDSKTLAISRILRGLDIEYAVLSYKDVCLRFGLRQMPEEHFIEIIRRMLDNDESAYVRQVVAHGLNSRFIKNFDAKHIKSGKVAVSARAARGVQS